MRTILSLGLGALLLAAPLPLRAVDALTEEVLRNQAEQTEEEKVFGEPSREFLERKLEPRETPSPPAGTPQSRAWPPHRSADPRPDENEPT